MEYRMNTPLLIDHVADATAHRDRDELNRSVARLLFQFLGAQSVALYGVLEHGQIKRVACRTALTHDRETPPDSLEDLRKLPELSSEPAWQACVAQGDLVQVAASDGVCRSVFPVQGEREVIGILEIATVEPLQPRDAGLVRGMLRILKNQLLLLDYGERDTLTGLLNRKTFETRFAKLCHALRESAGDGPPPNPIWLGLLDIDHFKSINDSHGHLFGDEVLLLVSQIMTRTLRAADQLFRFGGEEFVIVLEQVAPAGAHTAFERVRAAMEAYTFPQIGRVTISLGYTQIRLQDVPATCIERADAALYYAKHAGRNNTREYEALIAAGSLEDKDKAGDVELF